MKEKLELKKEGTIWILEKIESLLQQVYDHFRNLSVQNEYLIKENEKLKADNYRDSELQRMKEEHDRMKSDYLRGFPVTEEEEKKIKEWIMSKDLISTGAIGGRFRYEFIPTSIGTVGKVIDSVTNEEFTFRELN